MSYGSICPPPHIKYDKGKEIYVQDPLEVHSSSKRSRPDSDPELSGNMDPDDVPGPSHQQPPVKLARMDEKPAPSPPSEQARFFDKEDSMELSSFNADPEQSKASES